MAILGLAVIAIFVIWWFALRSGPIGPPDAANSFEAADIQPSAVTLIWRHDGRGENVVHWKLKRRVSGTGLPFVLINESLDAASRRVVDEAVDPGTSYEYQLLAVGEKGHESVAVEVALTTGA